jgi:hypothetical protein
LGKSEQYELESILSDLQYAGIATISLRKLFRLLGKGNRAAGTWKSLLDAWEEAGGDRSSLHICQIPHEMILLSTVPTKAVTDWAGE